MKLLQLIELIRKIDPAQVKALLDWVKSIFVAFGAKAPAGFAATPEVDQFVLECVAKGCDEDECRQLGCTIASVEAA